MVSDAPPGDCVAVDNDVKTAGQDEVHVVFGLALDDDRLSRIDLFEFRDVGQDGGESRVAGHKLLLSQDFFESGAPFGSDETFEHTRRCFGVGSEVAP
jgi:hypothetical protein